MLNSKFYRHGKNGQNFYFTELVFNCIWQLSFGNIYNRSRLREAGAENILWRISNSPSATTAQRSRAQAVLGWLKSQVLFIYLLIYFLYFFIPFHFFMLNYLLAC